MASLAAEARRSGSFEASACAKARISNLIQIRPWQICSSTETEFVLDSVKRLMLTEADAADMLTWRGTGGFGLDGSVRIAAHDRAGLQRLLRYCARPPFALHRLRPESSRVPLRSSDARLIYELPRPAHDGRTVVRVSPLELLDRLARLNEEAGKG